MRLTLKCFGMGLLAGGIIWLGATLLHLFLLWVVPIRWQEGCLAISIFGGVGAYMGAMLTASRS